MGNCCCPDRGGSGAGGLLTDELCGNFTIACGDPAIVWSSTLPIAAGTISVFYDRGCASDLLVEILNAGVVVGTFTVPDAPPSATGNTRALTVIEEFDAIQITCDGDPPGDFCNGKFCVTAHYAAR